MQQKIMLIVIGNLPS